MYSRPPMGRFPRGMRVPENYGGSAFTASAEEPEEALESPQKQEEINLSAAQEPSSDSHTESEGASAAPAMAKPSRGFKLDLGRFFPSNRSFGMEEFLIIALILLLAQGDSGDDTIIFLILLLFIG